MRTMAIVFARSGDTQPESLALSLSNPKNGSSRALLAGHDHGVARTISLCDAEDDTISVGLIFVKTVAPCRRGAVNYSILTKDYSSVRPHPVEFVKRMQHGLGPPTLGLGQLENDTVIRKSRQSGSVETPGRIKRQAGPGKPPSEPVNSYTTVPFQWLPERLALNTPPATSRVCSPSTGGSVQVSARVPGQRVLRENTKSP
jgi:hypothetical protein